jgi:uncharacterized protein with PQ loop repeat
MIATEKVIALCADGISLYSMYPQFKKLWDTGDTSSYSRASVYLGLLASTLWLIYYILRKTYTPLLLVVLGISFDFYILYKLQTKNQELKSYPQESSGGAGFVEYTR